MSVGSTLADHPVADLTIAIYVLSALVGSAPSPEDWRTQPVGFLLYQWLYVFMHTLMNNAEAAMRAKYPQINLSPIPPAQDAGKKQ